MNTRCHEKTNLTDTPANRKQLAKVVERMQAQILLGSFDYGAYFPKSDKASYFKDIQQRQQVVSQHLADGTPLFADFVSIWLDEKRIEWRATYAQKVQIILR